MYDPEIQRMAESGLLGGLLLACGEGHPIPPGIRDKAKELIGAGAEELSDSELRALVVACINLVGEHVQVAVNASRQRPNGEGT